MKKLICLILCAVMLLTLCACGAQPEAPAQETAPAEEALPAADVSEFKTMGDVFVYDSDNSGFSDDYYVYVFEKDGVDYRAVTKLPAEVSAVLWELDIFDEDYDAKLAEVVGPLEITQLDNLTEMVPAQEELDALVGTNVQELLDEGWSFWYWNMEVMEGGMYHGPFSYMMEYEGSVNDPENFDESQADALTVKSATYDGIGDAVGDFLNAVNESESDSSWYDDESFEDGQNPVMNFVGNYQSDRARALVECFGNDEARITIEWGGSAWEFARGIIVGRLDTETLTIAYEGANKSVVTVDDSGEESAEEVYMDGTGTITFHDDGTFTWHEDQSEYGVDMLFEWVPAASETVREDGERFEAVIILEGMEETVQYEHIVSEALGLEMDYDYESFERNSYPELECFISVWDGPGNPENFFEVTHRAEDVDTVAAAVREELSQTYDLYESTRELDRAGECLYIEASVLKGTNNMADQLQMVYIIPTADGCIVATVHCAAEAAEGFARRCNYMINTISAL